MNRSREMVTSAASKTSVKELFHRYLQEQGLKCTEQRDCVLESLMAAESHVSAEELYQELRRSQKTIGFSTVYRTLRLLQECSLAREVHLADGRAYFEKQHDTPHHDHMVCTSCRKLMEFLCPAIEELQDQVALQHGFLPTHHTMVIYGLCSSCRANGGGRRLGAPAEGAPSS